MHSSGIRRTYNSSRRKLQARQTRAQILEAARKLFTERGYSGATIEAIAAEAGVATETVYSVFGNKLAILSGLVDVSVVGDQEPVPLLERPAIQAAREETDQRRLIHSFAGNIYEIMNRMSPIFSVLRTAAKTEPEIAKLLEKLLNGRLEGMAFFIDQLRRMGPIRDFSISSQSIETAWAISSAEVFDLLTRERGWAEEEYTGWLTEALCRLLLPSPANNN